jgi:hypothetical protein
VEGDWKATATSMTSEEATLWCTVFSFGGRSFHGSFDSDRHTAADGPSPLLA